MPAPPILRILPPRPAHLATVLTMIDIAVLETSGADGVGGGFAEVVDEVGGVCVAVVVFVLEDVGFFDAGGGVGGGVEGAVAECCGEEVGGGVGGGAGPGV